EESRPHAQHPSRHSSVACHGSLPGADPVRALAYLVVMLRLASPRIEAPSAAFSCGETKEYEAEQHRGLAAIGQRIEALRGMTNEMSEGHLAGENEGGDARKSQGASLRKSHSSQFSQSRFACLQKFQIYRA